MEQANSVPLPGGLTIEDVHRMARQTWERMVSARAQNADLEQQREALTRQVNSQSDADSRNVLVSVHAVHRLRASDIPESTRKDEFFGLPKKFAPPVAPPIPPRNPSRIAGKFTKDETKDQRSAPPIPPRNPNRIASKCSNDKQAKGNSDETASCLQESQKRIFLFGTLPSALEAPKVKARMDRAQPMQVQATKDDPAALPKPRRILRAKGPSKKNELWGPNWAEARRAREEGNWAGWDVQHERMKAAMNDHREYLRGITAARLEEEKTRSSGHWKANMA